MREMTIIERKENMTVLNKVIGRELIDSIQNITRQEYT